MALAVGGATAVAAAELPATESTDQYTFQGIIRDGQTPLEGVEITVSGNGVEETVATDASGAWSVGVVAVATLAVAVVSLRMVMTL